MRARISLTVGALAAAAMLSACGGGAVAVGGSDTAAYPEYTIQPDASPSVNPELTPPGTVLAVGSSALIGYHTLSTDDDGDVVVSTEEQPIRVTVTGMANSSIGNVPRAFRLSGADAGDYGFAAVRVTWTATIDGPSVISMAKHGLQFGADGSGAYVASDPSAIPGCSGPATLGAGFDSGATVTGCFYIVYQSGTGAPAATLFVYGTPTESKPIRWEQ